MSGDMQVADYYAIFLPRTNENSLNFIREFSFIFSYL